MMKITVTIPITSSSVNSISITSPHREGKKEINAFPLREATATVLVFSGYLSISTVLYHIFVLQSTLQRLLFSALPHYLIGKHRSLNKVRRSYIKRVRETKKSYFVPNLFKFYNTI